MSTPTYTVSQRFFFDAAHTLRRQVEAEGSARVHGHTYEAEVFFSGQPDAHTGMVVDLGWVRQRVAQVRELLDHRLLDEVPGLGTPTIENLCHFIALQFQNFHAPDSQARVSRVRVWRQGIGDACQLDL
jgi:6-pyruvoyltetrahydropterin/6-carboxytetrahydropterin synthase